MKKLIIITGIIMSAVYLVLVWYLYVNQRDIIFYPSKEYISPPEELDVEEVYFRTSDGEVLSGWWMDDSQEKTVLFFHGNAGNISDRVFQMRIFKKLGLNALMFDYRGYGKSSGEIVGEADFYIDGYAALSFLEDEKKISAQNIIIWGRSLGAAGAIEVAQNRNIGRIIVESAFFSVKDMARAQYPFIPTSLVLQYKMENGKKIKNIKAPIMIIHSTEDEIVPHKQGYELFQNANKPKAFLEIKGGHNTGYMLSESKYLANIKEFVEN